MKKKGFIGLLFFALILANHVDAQVKFGVKAGLNLSSISMSELDNWDRIADSRTGFQVGPIMEITVPLLGVGADIAVLYSQRGASIQGETFKSDFIEVPLNLKWKFGLPIAKVYVAAGPYIGFSIGDSVWKNLKTQMENDSFSAGLNIGAGVELLSHLQVGANYTYGLTNNYGGDLSIGDQLFKGNDGKVRGWSITAAYLF